MTFDLESIIRPNILKLQPYRCARDDYSSGILLDANENALGPALSPSSSYKGLERYPDPHLANLKSLYAASFRSVSSNNLCFGVGSDEILDLLIRCFCIPGRDSILICPPTYGFFKL